MWTMSWVFSISKSKYECPFRAHQEEAKLLKNAPIMGDMFGLKRGAIIRD